MQNEELKYLIKVVGADEIKRALAEVEQQAEQTGEAGGDAVTEMSEGFGGLAGKMAAAVGGIISVASAVSFVTAAVREFKLERDRAAEGLKDWTASMGQLFQISGGDPKRAMQLIGEAEKTRQERGVPAQQAADLQFTLASLGLEKERGFFSGFYGITDPKALAESASTVQKAFGAQEAGDIREVVNKLVTTAAASKFKVETLSPYVAMAAQQAAAIGTSDEETMAAMSTLSEALKSPEQASTQINALARGLLKQGIGGGLMAGVQQVEQKGLTDQQLLEFLGSDEAFRAMRSIRQNRAVITEQRARITQAGAATGTPEDLSAKIVGLKAEVPGFAEVTAAKSEEQKLAAKSEETLGPEQAMREAATSRVKREAIERGENKFARFARSAIAITYDLLGKSPEELEAAAGGVTDFGQGKSRGPLWEPKPEPAPATPPVVNNYAIHNGHVYTPRQADPTKAPSVAVGGN